MKITITLEDDPDGDIRVAEVREPGAGETEETVTRATALADAMFAVLDELGEMAPD